ncbi:hypothetical protein [Oceanobacillus bengalensis]|uniref:VCBS repeat-containing protein n=1 Tax=Oceanobacillus bengalensis TaxID=1435466 RepID=A0A494YWG0_9BACI|nr:hypothetical protein [Oceanobacillus bengalensis]RKQ14529.1 hypothetical protein D8M05_12915 [Oceanobacillus bengalensis]
MKIVTVTVGIILTVLQPYLVLASSSEQETIVIETYQADITGDGLFEAIELKGTPFSPDAEYFHNIWAEIKSPNDESWTINYGGGYEPEIHFFDFNHDKIKDMLYQSPTGGSGGLYHYDLHTLAGNNLAEIPLPKQPYVSGEFIDDFKVEIKTSPNAEPIIMDVHDRADEYVRLEIYDQDGKLLKDTSPIIEPIAFFESVKISDSKGYGLKSFKQVSGAFHADQLGTIESLWYFTEGEWIILKLEWQEAK